MRYCGLPAAIFTVLPSIVRLKRDRKLSPNRPSAPYAADHAVCGMKAHGGALFEIDLGLLGEARLHDNVACASVQYESARYVVDKNGNFDDPARARRGESLGSAATRCRAAALGGVVREHSARLGGVVPRRIECDPPFNRQHGVAELPQSLVIASHVVVADAINAIFVAKHFDRSDVIVDCALERFVAVVGESAQEIAVVAKWFEPD